MAEAGSAGVAVKYAGPIECGKACLSKLQVLGVFFRGLVPTLAREIPGNAVMFVSL